jgi:hypothetical protein
VVFKITRVGSIPAIPVFGPFYTQKEKILFTSCRLTMKKKKTFEYLPKKFSFSDCCATDPRFLISATNETVTIFL